MSVGRTWLDARMAEAPATLRARSECYLEAAVSGPDDAATLARLPEQIARAAYSALDVVLAHDGGRSAALDLLAADGLITLALLAKAEQAPESLEAFATELMRG